MSATADTRPAAAPGAADRDALRFGVLGCADIARRKMFPALAAVPEARAVAVASRDPAKAARTAREFGCEAVTGYQQLLDDPDVEAVYVPLPIALHAHWVRRALEAGKHVLAEKSLTVDAASAADLVRLARSRGLLLVENYMFLHHGQHRRVRELAREIGPLRHFSSAFGFRLTDLSNIRYRRSLGGGALLDAGGYPVRAAQLFLGPDLTVIGSTLTCRPGHEVETAGAAMLSTPEGVTADVAFGYDRSYRSYYELWGTRGRIVLERAFTPPPDWTPVVRLEREGTETEVRLEPDDNFANAVSAFVRAVRTGDHGTYADDIVRQAELLDAVRSGADSGMPDLSCRE